ncbi:hypothetical protein [Actinoplanes sp. GCM10030250]|uniref:hypothetical protein n=1 Tax=Actinoplanes sp. GCM10030250 TaxID=3273376 RepID=UPI003614753C
MVKLGKATVVATVTATVLSGGAAAWAAYSWTQQDKVKVVAAGAAEPTVTVAGDVTGLLPGKTAPLRVTIKNNNDYPVRVTKLSGGNAATGSGCPEWAVRVKPIEGFTVPARSTKKITIRIGMEEWADQKCAGQDLSFDLTTVMTAA